MALVAGTVSVDDAGVVTKSGAAGRLFDALSTTDFHWIFRNAEVTELEVSKRRFAAELATAFASWVVTEMTTQAAVTVTIGTSASGLQRMPASTTEDTDTKAPAASKTLPGVIV